MVPPLEMVAAARRILGFHPDAPADLGPEYRAYASGALTLVDYYKSNPELLRPFRTHDAAPARHVDDLIPNRSRDDGPPSWAQSRTDPESTTGRRDMGSDPASPAGSELVRILPGNVTSYFIQADGRGRACLYRTVEADDALTGDRLQRDALGRDAVRRVEQRGIAATVRRFWNRQQAGG